MFIFRLTDENGKDFNAYFNDLFIKPYTRVGPYMVGIVTGYIMYETEGSMPFKGRVKNAVGLAIIPVTV